jgi:hypothetical protein
MPAFLAVGLYFRLDACAKRRVPAIRKIEEATGPQSI